MGQIITFYSYKGGVGRTMALANVAVLLTQWGYKVLIVDWDLEAPGLENFFKKYLDLETVAQHKGVTDLLDYISGKPVNWQDLLVRIMLPDSPEALHFLTAGQRDEDYFSRVRNLNLKAFYKQEGGFLIEQLRNEWKGAYDYVLVDSRTGITDIGGVCTIQLPDILVLLFTANDQSLNGVIDVARKANRARQKLPFDLRIGFQPRLNDVNFWRLPKYPISLISALVRSWRYWSKAQLIRVDWDMRMRRLLH
ncbi:AAA family ATPase [Candidatus Poribacteria bacterium]|nr:AAA family ATPase [Candidatus Poribacteria bacterium]